MRAGTLRHRIMIQRRTGSVNGWDEPLPEGWVDHVKLWADVLHRSGLSTIKADADTSIVKASIRIRWRTDITAGMRVLHGSAVYDIDAVMPGPKREYVDLVCKVVT